jgi:hypothetical protein
VTIEKNVNFFNGGVFFLLTRPLMGDPNFPLVLMWNKLMVLDEQMMVLNERFAFELNLRHRFTPFLRHILF